MYKCSLSTLTKTVLIGLSINFAATISLVLPSPNFAQTNLNLEQEKPSQRQIAVRVPAGTKLSVNYNGPKKILVSPNEPAPIPLKLELVKTISDFNAYYLIPAGSQIIGELVTMQDQKTAQFVAKELVLSNGRRIEISATSRIIQRTSEISKNQKVERIIKNSALGTAAAAAFAAMSGNPLIASQEVLLNSGFGSSPELIGTFRNQEKATIITIFPNNDFTLTLNSDLVLR
ncbi:hypothetical protein ACE1B6_18035 [Aerosakkonemataceae cyanobacterium BLCC-F154]|uniref:Uncharacterized protein n=1 Tax=Floridaenema fluviatile BLCC-F154 TaxID=3153640 RepID=A0ABV4YE87_9CYAN